MGGEDRAGEALLGRAQPEAHCREACTKSCADAKQVSNTSAPAPDIPDGPTTLHSASGAQCPRRRSRSRSPACRAPQPGTHLDGGVREAAADQALGIEHGVDRVHGHLVLGSIAHQALGVGEGDIGWRGAVALHAWVASWEP